MNFHPQILTIIGGFGWGLVLWPLFQKGNEITIFERSSKDVSPNTRGVVASTLPRLDQRNILERLGYCKSKCIKAKHIRTGD